LSGSYSLDAAPTGLSIDCVDCPSVEFVLDRLIGSVIDPFLPVPKVRLPIVQFDQLHNK
jgi:hypothetical protein